MILDPDKKVEKEKEKHAEIYQSSQHPNYFSNEGSEFDTIHIDDKDDIKGSLNFDKILGIKEPRIRKKLSKERIKHIEKGTEKKEPKTVADFEILGTA